MARIRTIKPSFFLNEDLASLSPLHRLLYVGLWTQADCEGRLEDRPRRIKVEVLPYDDCDADAMLDDLDAAGFVIRYQAPDGRQLIAIPTFTQHQRISGKESQSGSQFPAPSSTGSTGEALGKHWGSIGEALDAQEGKGREGNIYTHASACVSVAADAPAEADTSPATAGNGQAEASEPAGERTKPTERPEDLQALWNAEADPSLPRWTKLTPTWQKQAQSRLRERPLREWRDVIHRLNESDYCRGSKGWTATHDWLFKNQENAEKVLAGKYDNRGSPNPGKPKRTGDVYGPDHFEDPNAKPF